MFLLFGDVRVAAGGTISFFNKIAYCVESFALN